MNADSPYAYERDVGIVSVRVGGRLEADLLEGKPARIEAAVGALERRWAGRTMERRHACTGAVRIRGGSGEMKMDRQRGSAWVVLALLACIWLPPGFAEEISAPDRSWRFVAPAGYERIQLENKDILAAFRKDDGDGSSRLIILKDLHGTIGREPLDERMVAAMGTKMLRVPPYDWKSFPVDAFEVPEEVDGKKFMTINVQVPIAPRAVQVMVFGPLSHRDGLQADAKSSVAGLDGTSNWLSPGQRVWMVVTGSMRLVFVAVILALPVIFLIRRLRRKRRVET